MGGCPQVKSGKVFGKIAQPYFLCGIPCSATDTTTGVRAPEVASSWEGHSFTQSKEITNPSGCLCLDFALLQDVTPVYFSYWLFFDIALKGMLLHLPDMYYHFFTAMFPQWNQSNR